MPYYRSCPDCGAALDPGERCECHRSAYRWASGEKTEKAALDAANNQGGKGE